MKKSNAFLLITAIFSVILFSSCKSEFERIRTSTEAPVILEGAHKYYKEGDYAKAQSLYEMVIPFYRGRKEAEEIYFKFAYCHYYLKQFILSAHYFKSFSSTFYNSEYEEEADFMAAYSNYKMSPSHRLDQSYSEKAINGFQIFVNKHPNSSRIDECNRLIDEMRAKMEKKFYEEAVLYYDLRQYQSAIQSFENLLEEYPETNRSEKIHFYLVRSAFQLAENSIYERKLERYTEAQKYVNKYRKKFPKSDRLGEVDDIYDDILKKINNNRS